MSRLPRRRRLASATLTLTLLASRSAHGFLLPDAAITHAVANSFGVSKLCKQGLARQRRNNEERRLGRALQQTMRYNSGVFSRQLSCWRGERLPSHASVDRGIGGLAAWPAGDMKGRGAQWEGDWDRGDSSSNIGGRLKNGDGGNWRRLGDVPAVVVGAGFLLSRHRRELRAARERRNSMKDGMRSEDMAATRIGMAKGAGAGVGVAARSRARADRRESRRKGESWWEDGEGEGDRAEHGRTKSDTMDRRSQQDSEEHDTGDEDDKYEEHSYSPTENRLCGDEWDTIDDSESSKVILDVSLDRSVMPEPVSPVVVWGGATAASLGAIAIIARIPRALGFVKSKVRETVKPAYMHSQLPAVARDLRYNCRLWGGSLRAWASRRAEAWDRTFGPEEIRLPIDEWSVCTLRERDRVGGDVVRYRFRLQGPPNVILPLGLAQELTLCGLDTSNEVVHGSYIPLSPRRQRGFFDIVVRKDGQIIDDGLGSMRNNKQFSQFLDKLPIGRMLGDEVAVKPGREGLVYNGPYSPITDLVLIATGLGVVPIIQMMNELLPSRESSVTSASVIWLNERAEDFVLYGELEKAFFRNHRKLDVSCIVERDLYGHRLEANPNVREAAPPFKIGTLAVVAGPEFFARKVTDYLLHQGYPEEAIVAL